MDGRRVTSEPDAVLLIYTKQLYFRQVAGAHLSFFLHRLHFLSSLPSSPADMAPLFPDRTHPDVLCLFDVDGTLTPARRGVSLEMTTLLADLRKHCAIGFVGGSDLPKITEQLEYKGQAKGESYFALLKSHWRESSTVCLTNLLELQCLIDSTMALLKMV
jgi:hypothetical protein